MGAAGQAQTNNMYDYTDKPEGFYRNYHGEFYVGFLLANGTPAPNGGRLQGDPPKMKRRAGWWFKTRKEVEKWMENSLEVRTTRDPENFNIKSLDSILL